MTAARSSAEQLPTAPGPANQAVSLGATVWALLCVAMITALPCAVAGFLLATTPAGWLAVLVGVALWGLATWLWARVLPEQQLTVVAVDAAGTIRVPVGSPMVVAHRRMLEEGSRGRTARSVLLGAVLVLGGGLATIVAAVTLFPPDLLHVPSAVLILAVSLAMARMFLRGTLVPYRVRRGGGRVLDSAHLLPLLALYAVVRGDAAATSGVPADELMQVVEEADPDLRARAESLTERNLLARGMVS